MCKNAKMQKFENANAKRKGRKMTEEKGMADDSGREMMDEGRDAKDV